MPLSGEVERKLAALQAWVIALVAFMLVAVTVMLVTTVVLVSRTRDRQNQALACYVLPQLDRAEQTLPTLEYYRLHPKELAGQLDLIRSQRELALKSWGSCDEIRP